MLASRIASHTLATVHEDASCVQFHPLVIVVSGQRSSSGMSEMIDESATLSPRRIMLICLAESLVSNLYFGNSWKTTSDTLSFVWLFVNRCDVVVASTRKKIR